jgi:hypothetical protein
MAHRHNDAVERREREAILGERGVGAENPLVRAAHSRLAGELEGSPLLGKPLPRRVTLRPGADHYVSALGGPLAYMVRLRELDAEIAAHERALDAAWRELASTCDGDEAGFARRWRSRVARWSFGAVNELIERHNRYYPIESRLRMDVRTGDFALVGGKPYSRRPLDAAWALERFPPTRQPAS